MWVLTAVSESGFLKMTSPSLHPRMEESRGLKGFEITLYLLFRLQFAAIHAYRWAKCHKANRKP